MKEKEEASSILDGRQSELEVVLRETPLNGVEESGERISTESELEVVLRETPLNGVEESGERISTEIHWRSPGLVRRKEQEKADTKTVKQKVRKLKEHTICRKQDIDSQKERHSQILASPENDENLQKNQMTGDRKKKRIQDALAKLTPIILTPAVARNLKEKDWKRLRKPPKGLGKTLTKQKKKEKRERSESSCEDEVKHDDEEEKILSELMLKDYSIEGEDENIYFYYEGGEDASPSGSFYLNWKCVSEEEKIRLLRGVEPTRRKRINRKSLQKNIRKQLMSRRKKKKKEKKKKKKKRPKELTRTVSLLLRKLLGIPCNLIVKPTTGSIRAAENVVCSRLNIGKPISKQDQRKRIGSAAGLMGILYNEIQALRPRPLFFRPMTPKEQILSMLERRKYSHLKDLWEFTKHAIEDHRGEAYGQQPKIMVKLKRGGSSESPSLFSHKYHLPKNKVLVPFLGTTPGGQMRKERIEAGVADSSESCRSPSSSELSQQVSNKIGRTKEASETKRSDKFVLQYACKDSFAANETTSGGTSGGEATLIPGKKYIKKRKKRIKEEKIKDKNQENVQVEDEKVEPKRSLQWRPGEEKIKNLLKGTNTHCYFVTDQIYDESQKNLGNYVETHSSEPDDSEDLAKKKIDYYFMPQLRTKELFFSAISDNFPLPIYSNLKGIEGLKDCMRGKPSGIKLLNYAQNHPDVMSAILPKEGKTMIRKANQLPSEKLIIGTNIISNLVPYVPPYD